MNQPVGFCENCGALLTPDSLFCEKCGIPVSQPEDVASKEEAQPFPPSLPPIQDQQPSQQDKQAVPKSKTKYLIGGGIAAVFILSLGVAIYYFRYNVQQEVSGTSPVTTGDTLKLPWEKDKVADSNTSTQTADTNTKSTEPETSTPASPQSQDTTANVATGGALKLPWEKDKADDSTTSTQTTATNTNATGAKTTPKASPKNKKEKSKPVHKSTETALIAKPGITTSKKTFNKPEYKGHRLDWCLSKNLNCGKLAADRFCKLNGYAVATEWLKATDITETSTYLLDDRRACDKGSCDGFRYIICDNSNTKDKHDGKWLGLF